MQGTTRSGEGGKSLPSDPWSELRLLIGGREKRKKGEGTKNGKWDGGESASILIVVLITDCTSLRVSTLTNYVPVYKLQQ